VQKFTANHGKRCLRSLYATSDETGKSQFEEESIRHLKRLHSFIHSFIRSLIKNRQYAVTQKNE